MTGNNIQESGVTGNEKINLNLKIKIFFSVTFINNL